MSGLQAPPPRTTLHLYRHLLRETTYLPRVVRPFFWDRIRTRFRMHKRDPEPDDRVRKAHKDLRYLRSANAGHLLRMRYVLMMGFGRVGRRRRELISEMVAKNGRPLVEDDAQAGSATAKQTLPSADEDMFWDDWLAKWDKAKVQALARAQSTVDLPALPLPTKGSKTTDPAKLVPATNIWGKPLAKKLARSKLRKEYKALVRRLVPPVSSAEWDTLRRLATGHWEPKDAVPKRRTVARPATNGQAADDGWEWKDYLLKPVRAVDAKRSRTFRSLSGAIDDTSPFPRPPMGVHRFTNRLWRRLYGEIWRMTPTMDKKEGQEKWDTKWGKVKIEISHPTASQAEFFAGISNTGKI